MVACSSGHAFHENTKNWLARPGEIKLGGKLQATATVFVET
jgi:hypothetical protein